MALTCNMCIKTNNSLQQQGKRKCKRTSFPLLDTFQCKQVCYSFPYDKNIKFVAQQVFSHTDRLFVPLRINLLQKWQLHIISVTNLKLQDKTG